MMLKEKMKKMTNSGVKVNPSFPGDFKHAQIAKKDDSKMLAKKLPQIKRMNFSGFVRPRNSIKLKKKKHDQSDNFRQLGDTVLLKESKNVHIG